MDTFATFFLGLVASFGASWFYGFFGQYSTYRNLSKDHIINTVLHYYWYNSQTIRHKTEPNLCHATIKIQRNILGFLRLTQIHSVQNNKNASTYNYRGSVEVRENQIHLKKTGINIRETGYTILDRPLNLNDVMFGITLITSNDELKQPMAMRCILSPSKLSKEHVKQLLQTKAYVTSYTVDSI